MKLTIPDDWDGESWQCVQVQWPNSQAYRGLLLGFLSYLTRGRVYEEDSGSIKDAQAVGWQIWDRNYPFTSCDSNGDDDNGGEPPAPPTGGGFDFDFDLFGDCEEDMAGVLDIKIENGKLWKRMSPCCEWFEVGSLSDPDDPGDPWGDTDEDPEYSACGKAYAVVDIVCRIVEESFTAADGYDIWLWPGRVESEVGLDLENNHLARLLAIVVLYKNIGEEYSDVISSFEKQRLVCSVEALFSDDSSGVSDALYEQIKGVFQTVITPDVVGGLAVNRWQMFSAALNALGRGNMNRVAILGAGDTSRDCDCPDTPIDPRDDWPTSDWAVYYDLKQGVPDGFTLVGDTVWEAGKGIKVVPGKSGLMNPAISADVTIAADTTITYGWHQWYVLWSGTDYQGNKSACKMTSETSTLWQGSNYPDTDPSAGGRITKYGAGSLNPPDGSQVWAWSLEMNTLDGANEDRQVWVESIGLAGNGTNPFL